VALPVLHAASALVFDGPGRVLLIKENYGRHRYGLPGGRVEDGETPAEAAVREVREETQVDVTLGALTGQYTLRMDDHVLLCHVFLGTIERGDPGVPTTGEIAEVGWFDCDAIPTPQTSLVGPAVEDARAGLLGVAREIPVVR
jgi:8-oxo-dGTP pyrophosphatase MutT (NUDIX family)